MCEHERTFIEAWKNNWQNKEFRENGIKQLNSIRDKAKEWHKSKDGLEWHQNF